MYKKNYVVFKGSKDGLFIYLNKNFEFDVLKNQLIAKLDSAKVFFKGAKVKGFKGKKLTDEQQEEIKKIIHSRCGMTMIENKIENEKKVFNDTKFIRSTVRSGQRIEENGNVVVIGDVNPGAEIIAGGNIVVMGSLRGVAHAGSFGNGQAFVVAFNLQPTQLRIGDVIARAPDSKQIKTNIPEIATIKDKKLIIEPYLPKK
ncbi:septum site-determining protein MinC [Anaeromicrobium sediminis]|uniref:Probable septum site-determining protein MinC n=1 Tax=Anaeromicrobium sediminis TaxID=1478221 RepID=A0A267MPL9_9FIRM|nr:septum site-determining protein MinC [Anaeromicrobium sediminis]PAB61372.1 septum site-determining protein MinC [Anaeromicrobium sediminis]